MKRIRQARWAGALLAIGLLTAACSSGSSSPGVAAASSPAASGSGSASPGSSGSAGQSAEAKGIAYAQCMRSHGVTSFPDPQPRPNGLGLGWELGPSLNPNSPQYRAAVKACGTPPNLNGTPPPPLTAAQQQQYLKWAACIRAHGDPGFKDPTFNGGYPQITSNGSPAQLNAAMEACQSYLSGIPGAAGGGITSGGGGSQ